MFNSLHGDTVFDEPTRHLGCAGDWCSYTGVCVSSRDGVLVPNRSVLDVAWRQLLHPRTGWRRESQNWDNLAERLMPVNILSRPHVYVARGGTLVISCWRQPLGRKNPSHLMHGYGWLLQAALDSGRYFLPHSVGTIVFHQCPRHAEVSDWPFVKTVWEMLGPFAVEKRLLTNSLSQTNIITLGSHTGLWNRERPSNEMLLCTERAHVQQRLATWLGRQGKHESKAWYRLTASRWSQQHVGSVMRITAGKEVLRQQGGGSCQAQLRICIWRRSNDSARRSFVNHANVTRVASAFTSQEVRTLSASAATPLLEQVRLFRSFDILITPHGSHLATLMFGDPSAVIIELQPVHFDNTFCVNGRSLMKAYVMSYGHLPSTPDGQQVDAALEAEMARCHKGPNVACSRGVIKNRDMFVEIDHLRSALTQAVSARCDLRGVRERATCQGQPNLARPKNQDARREQG